MSLLPSRGPDASSSQDGELQIVGVDEDVSAVLDALSSETARDILNAVYDEPGTPSELADRLDMSIQKVSYHIEKLAEEELIAVAGTQYSEKGQEMTVYEPPDDPLVVFVGTRDRKRTLRSLLERLVPAIGLLTAASVMVQMVFGTLPSLFGSTESGDGPAAEPGVDDSEGGDDPSGNVTSDGSSESTPDGPSESVSQDTGVSAESTPDSQYETTGETAGETNGTEDSTGDGVDMTDATEDPTETPTPGSEFTSEVTETATDVAAGGGLDLEPGLAFFLGGVLVLAVVGLTWAYTQ